MHPPDFKYARDNMADYKDKPFLARCVLWAMVVLIEFGCAIGLFQWLHPKTPVEMDKHLADQLRAWEERQRANDERMDRLYERLVRSRLTDAVLEAAAESCETSSGEIRSAASPRRPRQTRPRAES